MSKKRIQPNKIFVTDETKLWYGKHKGKTMIDVPASYLVWCYDNNKCTANVRRYVEENREVLDKQDLEEKAEREENRKFLK